MLSTISRLEALAEPFERKKARFPSRGRFHSAFIRIRSRSENFHCSEPLVRTPLAQRSPRVLLKSFRLVSPSSTVLSSDVCQLKRAGSSTEQGSNPLLLHDQGVSIKIIESPRLAFVQSRRLRMRLISRGTGKG